MSTLDNVISMDTQRKKIFGANVKAERNRKRLSQFELAEKINVSEGTISLIERGIQAPSIFIVYDISKILNLKIEDLLKDIE